MKTNAHYAGALPSPWMGGVETDCGPTRWARGKPEQDLKPLEGRPTSRRRPYFGASSGVHRELSSPDRHGHAPEPVQLAAAVPGCTWTPTGFIEFLRLISAPRCPARGVEVFLGTLERPDDRLLGDVLQEPEVARFVSGLGVQWEGKRRDHRAAPPAPRPADLPDRAGVRRRQERLAARRYAWRLMKQFLGNGANAYMYWNISLLERGRSRWGWTQNSLVVVDPDAGTFQTRTSTTCSSTSVPSFSPVRGSSRRSRSRAMTTSSPSSTPTAASTWSSRTTRARTCRCGSCSASACSRRTFRPTVQHVRDLAIAWRLTGRRPARADAEASPSPSAARMLHRVSSPRAANTGTSVSVAHEPLSSRATSLSSSPSQPSRWFSEVRRGIGRASRTRSRRR